MPSCICPHTKTFIFSRYNTCIKLGTNLIKSEHTNSENMIHLSHAIILNDNPPSCIGGTGLD